MEENELALVHHILRNELEKVDPKAPELMKLLENRSASECWHKQGTFFDHLKGVWTILSLWKQHTAVSRCGLFHSAYGNSVVNLTIFKCGKDRRELADNLGTEAERLTHLFCSINKIKAVQKELPPLIEKGDIGDGVFLKDINSGDPIHVSRKDVKRILILSMADYADQLYEWQDRLFEHATGEFLSGDNPHSLWPGSFKPGAWMSGVSKLAKLARMCHEESDEDPLPPIFNCCSQEISLKNCLEAANIYFEVVCLHTEKEHHKIARKKLLRVIELNPWVAEPHLILAQIHCEYGQFTQAKIHAKQGLQLLYQWGTAWDKRLSWKAWIAWGRLLHMNAEKQEWPKDVWGIMNLGLIT